MALEFLIGVDGGGTGTRIRVADRDGRELARGSAGPSGLGLGIDVAWLTIRACIARTFRESRLHFDPSTCAIGLGLAGVHNPAWAEAFLGQATDFHAIRLDTDGFTTLLGAHGGQAGAIVAVGTGSIGEAWLGGTERRTVSGWGFPSGDEGSGAWIGMQAARLAQRALDGRAETTPLARAVVAQLGGDITQAFRWLGQATQTSYAQLTPLVLEHAANDAAAATILRQAGEEIADIARALDSENRLPIALCGGLAEALRPWLPSALIHRARQPLADSATGALHLIRGNI
ncbi:ATPase [Chitinimonas arctica]|uniref:ATPase n=1 Tax=Chitinimonas arctica TaxID=2594795 RepID=A0A516SDU2_9NEIS|nr:BadF/BadG/BcrA/BcrD ATPase family protein [Chitinimonas arctica]QDQ26327.1 ATPase [Chitinimonas arctica]